MSGVLRWVKWTGPVPEWWHLSFGDARTLCDEVVQRGHRARFLAAGAPSDRCPKCSEVIRLRLGLPEASK